MSENSPSSGGVGRALVAGLDRAIAIHQGVVTAHVRRLRARHPDADPAAVIAVLEKQYCTAVIAAGAAAGGAAAVPGIGTVAAVAANAGELAGFLEASALFALAVGEVHGIQLDDLERRRTLVLAALLGNGGAGVVEETAGHAGQYWGKLVTEKIPLAAIKRANKVLGQRVIARYGARKGIIAIGRLAPFGIGAGIGGVGNALLARTVVAGVRDAFGPPPEHWPDDVA